MQSAFSFHGQKCSALSRLIGVDGVHDERVHRLVEATRSPSPTTVGNFYLNRTITGALVGVQPFGGFTLSGSNSKAGGPDTLRLSMGARTVTERF